MDLKIQDGWKTELKSDSSEMYCQHPETFLKLSLRANSAPIGVALKNFAPVRVGFLIFFLHPHPGPL